MIASDCEAAEVERVVRPERVADAAAEQLGFLGPVLVLRLDVEHEEVGLPELRRLDRALGLTRGIVPIAVAPATDRGAVLLHLGGDVTPRTSLIKPPRPIERLHQRARAAGGPQPLGHSRCVTTVAAAPVPEPHPLPRQHHVCMIAHRLAISKGLDGTGSGNQEQGTGNQRALSCSLFQVPCSLLQPTAILCGNCATGQAA